MKLEFCMPISFTWQINGYMWSAFITKPKNLINHRTLKRHIRVVYLNRQLLLICQTDLTFIFWRVWITEYNDRRKKRVMKQRLSPTTGIVTNEMEKSWRPSLDSQNVVVIHSLVFCSLLSTKSDAIAVVDSLAPFTIGNESNEFIIRGKPSK